MSTFDQILPIINGILLEHRTRLDKLGRIVINRDLNGRVRLVVDDAIRTDPEAMAVLDPIVKTLTDQLGPHGFAVENMVIFESDITLVTNGAPHFSLEFENVVLVDRLATDTDWSAIAPVSSGAPRIVFFSIKGGVGRSTALAVSAWWLAQKGKRVMVLDLDLESPGLSSSLLPYERRPMYGIADWLVEDLVDNGAAVFDDMVATSDLSHDGEIYVVPAHGRDSGEYISKLGRVWMPKVGSGGTREALAKRLNRLLDNLEQRWKPDVVLIDSRAGIDEVASACVTDLGARGILLFSIDGEQTWTGYTILFHHWQQTGVVRNIRERIQMVGAMIPEVEAQEYFQGLCERAWTVFSEELYDEVPAGEPSGRYFSFDESDETAPHFPWKIRWHRSFAALRSIYSRFDHPDPEEVTGIYGPFVEGIRSIAEGDLHG